MLSVFQLWTVLGLVVAEGEAFKGPGILSRVSPHSPVHDPPSRSVPYTHDPIALSSTPVIWDSESVSETETASAESTVTEGTTSCTTDQITVSPTPSVAWSSESEITSLTPVPIIPIPKTSVVWSSESETPISTPVSIIPIPKPSTKVSTVSVFATESKFFTLPRVTTPVVVTTTSFVPTTITPPPSPPPNPCPTTCSISAGTVNLFFWPSDDHEYPSTYVNTHLDYTFTSPSVYMVIDRIYGYNTAGRAGPSGTSVVFPLDLDQVSTIIEGSVTQQLTLSDLGTDCPQTEDASVIATAAPNGRCDPILAAPVPVKSWASPCNACGNFGLFDPPYAVAPLTGDLVPETTTTSMTRPDAQTTTSVELTTDSTATSTIPRVTSVESSSSEAPSSSETTVSSSESTIPSSESSLSVSESSMSVSETVASSSTVTNSEATSLTTETSSDAMPIATPTSLPTPGESTGLSSSSSTYPSASTPATAAAPKRSITGAAWVVMSVFASACLL